MARGAFTMHSDENDSYDQKTRKDQNSCKEHTYNRIHHGKLKNSWKKES